MTFESKPSNAKKLLLLGDTGKMGCAIRHAFASGYDITGCNRSLLDVQDFDQVAKLVRAERPDVVVNAVALQGIDRCEDHPAIAMHLNVLLPKHLAELTEEQGAVLCHFSTDAVLGDTPGQRPVESDAPHPLSVYALTKYGGDCMVQSISPRAFVFRLPMLFGESMRQDQFVEKMLARVYAGAHRLEVSSDVVGTPSYSRDIAGEVKRIIESNLSGGLYHLANQGQASLHEIIALMVDHLGLGVRVEAVSHERFPSRGRKNIHTTMGSERIAPLRPWRVAFREYCENLRTDEESRVRRRRRLLTSSQHLGSRV